MQIVKYIILAYIVILKNTRRTTSLGEKFERKKVRIAEKVEIFSSKFFLVQMEAEVLQQWHTTHFKACSK